MDFIKNNSLFIKLVIMVSLALCPPILLSHLAGSYFISKYGFEQAEQTVANVAQLTAESSAVIEGMEEPRGEAWKPVSYTHLDVYKRQASNCLNFCCGGFEGSRPRAVSLWASFSSQASGRLV